MPSKKKLINSGNLFFLKGNVYKKTNIFYSENTQI